MKHPDVSVLVVSANARAHLQRCLEAVAGGPCEVVVVDNGSQDGSLDLVRTKFAGVRLIELGENRGVAVALNEAMRSAAGRYYLVLNSDAWPVAGAIAKLAAFADLHRDAGAVAPRLLNADGSLQRSVRGFPTLWRLATECFFLRKLAPRSRAFNAFYGCNFDHESERVVDWVKAAVLLLRREAVEEVGGYDPDFFVFSDEVDLCYRLRHAGWSVRFCPSAEFVHLGGVSTIPQWGRMHRELIRGQLLFFAKHGGLGHAERARLMLLVALRMRGRLFRGDRGRLYRETSRWVASGCVPDLIGVDRDRYTSNP